jgi:hypothetical protein
MTYGKKRVEKMDYKKNLIWIFKFKKNRIF